ncbi:MAG: type II toxin-antitoxin system VapC family toxin [Acidobacteria bacterium]|nr:type II toxin-antitoxin system VapC family toxin [Acidobacteriota bacterium]
MATGSTQRGDLDTNTFVLLERIADVSSLPDEPMITAVTLAEISAGLLVANSQEQAIRHMRLRQVEADFRPLPFDAAAARSVGLVAASLRRDGRKLSARAFDAMVAATAIANDLPLYACYPSDFEAIDDLDSDRSHTPTVHGTEYVALVKFALT